MKIQFKCSHLTCVWNSFKNGLKDGLKLNFLLFLDFWICGFKLKIRLIAASCGVTTKRADFVMLAKH
ncbi:hypothetical protein BpHYR1_023813 [Brachionus plicatilis]|uniref:Uncharacterized protein n=1 Tax=Brachionus plicatilis TaxID=10195 RepID=A0A3M7R0K9_BRAPC|nr:hypothetical protein BpHYR1_023813 [Brachionus plicatilis]